MYSNGNITKYNDQDWNEDYGNGNDQRPFIPSSTNTTSNLVNAVSLLSVSHNAPNALTDQHIQSRQASSPHYHARIAAVLARNQLSSRTTTNQGTMKSIDDGSSTQQQERKEDNKNSNQQLWTVLDIGGLGLKHLSSSLFAYDFLTAVYMNHNQLTYIHPDIVKLSHLEILDCSGNNITEVFPGIGQLASLKELLLFDNQIVTLPNEIGMLYRLETLGLEGNPLQNDLQNLIMNEGTQGLISSLREHMPVGLPPPSREWLTIEDNENISDSEAEERFTVLSYNTLCPKYVNDQKYGYTPAWALEWDYRKELLFSEINDIDADILCLQEVAMDDFESVFTPYLKNHGNYDGIFYPKSRAKTMSENDRKWVDGCATFFKSSRYKLVDHLFVEFNKKGLERPDFKSSKDTYNRLMPKDNIAIFSLLEDIKTQNMVIVTNSQLTWDPAFSDVKLVQIGIMMDELCQFASRTILESTKNNLDGKQQYTSITSIPILICGDFNSEPNSGLYEYLTKGNLDHDHDEFNQCQYGSFTANGLQHDLSLKSGYSYIGELDFTNFTPDYKGTLDYIFFTTKTLDVVSVLGPLDPVYMSNVVGIPNPHFPSE
ncbi:Endonuclease/exonuclease/phosphatase [Halteromyces radiatus]|uniref:Endonuclease/exonuclease/phosphatase n=1 Tax=Halteromyces radiatus TaxID=101107 RepID=UPI0022207A62|nr:Endonuclease/exonuclease/phosphatase [Halteromyces radiatus]KAI8086105.1 Endonuclease/exonuclease/phosphatase [Halteromyces radiatus]